jgi:hypothetical protein
MGRPKHITERMFLRAVRAVPVAASDSGRSSYGVLYLKWDCPCPEIEALWASALPTEIILSCRVASSHFTRTRYIREHLTSLALKRRMIRDAVREIELFLEGEIAVSTSYSPNGAVHSYGWGKTKNFEASREYERKIFGPAITTKAWSWSGAIDVATN